MQTNEAVAGEFSLSDVMFGRHVECEKHPGHFRMDVRYKRTPEGSSALGNWIMGECKECGKDRTLETQAREILNAPEKQRELKLRTQEQMAERSNQIAEETEQHLQSFAAEYKPLIQKDVESQHRENVRSAIELQMIAEEIEKLRGI